MATILSIESSCDETAVAILKDKKELLANIVSSQIDTHQLYGGVVPELASRLHVQNISIVLKEALAKAHLSIDEIDAIAVTKGPGLVGSLHVGIQAAKTLALYTQKPLIGVHHIVGHIYANALVNEIVYPCLCLVVSGGHTELVYMEDEMQFKVIGTTLDDAVGEAYDKVGRVAHLPYPGGPIIDRLSKQGKPNYSLPKPMDDESYHFSFSGLKSAVINLAHRIEQRHETLNVEDLAYSFQHAALDILVEKTMRAAKAYQVKQIMLAGGVSANSLLREMFQEAAKKENISLSLPPLWCCTDNAAMIAMAGSIMYDYQMFSSLDLSVKPGIDIELESRGGIDHGDQRAWNIWEKKFSYLVNCQKQRVFKIRRFAVIFHTLQTLPI